MANYRLSSYVASILCCLATASLLAWQPAVRSAMSSKDAAALSHGLADYNGGDKAAAMPELKPLAIKYPDNFPANEALGLLYIDEGSFIQSLPYLEHAANAKKENAVAQANLGAAYLQVGDTKSAVRSLKRAAALDTKNVQTLSNLGHALFLDKQAQAAADVFAQALKEDPTNMDIRYNNALALHVVGKDASASEVLQNIATAERNEAVELLWGDVAEKQGEFKEAVNHMQAAVQLNPSEQNISALTVELLRHWTWKPAIEIAEYGVKRFPESRRLQLGQAIALFGSKNYAGAAEVLGALLSLDPDNEYYGDLLGKSCIALGWSGSPQCDSLADFADKHPANAQVAVYAASNILHVSDPDAKDKLDRAQQMLERAIRVDPKIAKAYCELGTLQQERLQWKESVLSLNKAVKLRPAYPEAHYRLARAYAHLQEPDLANKERTLLLKDDQQVQDDSKTIISEVTTFLVESH